MQLIDLNVCGDENGKLIALEQHNNIPFDIKRVYYIFDTKTSVSRGFHAHKNLEQVVVCVKGSCEFILDDGKCRETILMDRPEVGLYIKSNTWREMHEFSADCVLVVLASELYDTSDYILDYSEFIASI